MAEVLADDDPLAHALAATASAALATSPAGRPVDDDGRPMLTVREAVALIGKERSGIARQLNAGALRGRKIGNEWWTTQAWCDAYRARPAPPPPPRSAGLA